MAVWGASAHLCKVMVKLSSTNIDGVHYGHSDGAMYIQFLNGSVYRYDGVPFATYQGLLNTDSPGRYLNREIKGKYQFLKVERIPPDESDIIRPGEIVIDFTVSQPDPTAPKRITLQLSEERSITFLGNEVPVAPYWMVIKVKGCAKLFRAAQDILNSSNAISGQLAWDGSYARIVENYV